MVFGSEFGVIPDAILGSGLGKVPPEILDTFLLTLKSNWIDWSLVLAEKLPPLKYFNEDEDHFLSGRFTVSDSCQPAPGQVIFLSSPGKNAEFQYAETDNEGYFNFHIPIRGSTTYNSALGRRGKKGPSLLIHHFRNCILVPRLSLLAHRPLQFPGILHS